MYFCMLGSQTDKIQAICKCAEGHDTYLGTCFGAVHDGVALVQWPLITHLLQALRSKVITRVHDPPINTNTKIKYTHRDQLHLYTLISHWENHNLFTTRNQWQAPFSILPAKNAKHDNIGHKPIWPWSVLDGMPAWPVCLHDDSWAQVFVTIPPVTRARCAAACTQDTLIHAIL